MSRKSLTTYLNDHLAGSVAALELLDHLIALQRGTDRERSFTALRAEVEEDQKTLQQLLAELGAKESRVRQAAAWLTEKLGQAKLQLDDSGSGELQLLEALEALGLGIQGKLGLWRALAAASDGVPQLSTTDFRDLERRALDQHQWVEMQRIQAARAALAPT